MSVIFDIETCANVTESDVPPFDPASVKCGNIKDEAKKAAKIEERRKQHIESFLNRAALSSVHGRVLAIAFYSIKADADGKEKRASSIKVAEVAEEESVLLQKFWSLVDQLMKDGRSMIGLNIFGFDLPFLLRRSWILGVDLPEGLRVGRGWSPMFIDLADQWLAGDRFGSTPCNFNELARAFGTPGKPKRITAAAGSAATSEEDWDGSSAGTSGSPGQVEEEIGGADFARMFFAGGEERDMAIKYAISDVEQPAVWAKRMGLIL